MKVPRKERPEHATGGIDCGTGIGPMMEAARLIALSGAKPKRTILFIAFAGEEFGLLGAKAYARTHQNELCGERRSFTAHMIWCVLFRESAFFRLYCRMLKKEEIPEKS